MNSIENQYKRIERLAQKVLNNINREQHDYDDDVRQFFQECWNLKDRIKNDEDLEERITRTVEEEVSNYPHLEIIADLANRTKHYKLTRHIRKDAKVGNITVNIRAGKPGTGHAKITYRIDTDDGESIELADLVEGAIESWRKILDGYGIDT